MHKHITERFFGCFCLSWEFVDGAEYPASNHRICVSENEFCVLKLDLEITFCFAGQGGHVPDISVEGRGRMQSRSIHVYSGRHGWSENAKTSFPSALFKTDAILCRILLLPLPTFPSMTVKQGTEMVGSVRDAVWPLSCSNILFWSFERSLQVLRTPAVQQLWSA